MLNLVAHNFEQQEWANFSLQHDKATQTVAIMMLLVPLHVLSYADSK